MAEDLVTASTAEPDADVAKEIVASTDGALKNRYVVRTTTVVPRNSCDGSTKQSAAGHDPAPNGRSTLHDSPGQPMTNAGLQPASPPRLRPMRIREGCQSFFGCVACASGGKVGRSLTNRFTKPNVRGGWFVAGLVGRRAGCSLIACCSRL